MTIKTGETSAAYSLAEYFQGGQTYAIDADQYATLSKALTTVVSAMEIEELFQVFAQSFLRFEKDLLEVAFKYAFAKTQHPGDEVFLSNIRHRFNVNIITILTSYKSYDDHCNRILKSPIDLPEATEFNTKKRSEIFDTHLSYRICDGLRNYAQHQALPLGGFSIGGKTNIGSDSAGRKIKLDTAYSVSPWFNVLKFKGSSQCKAKLREDLDNLGYEKIDMTWLIRSFASAMYERHAALREILEPKIVSASKKISEGYEFASTAKKGEVKILELCRNDQKRPMRKDLAAIVLRAFETHTSLKSAQWSYVTSQIAHEAATYSGQSD